MASPKANLNHDVTIIDDVDNIASKPCQFTVKDYRQDYEAEVARGRQLLGLLSSPVGETPNQESQTSRPVSQESLTAKQDFNSPKQANVTDEQDYYRQTQDFQTLKQNFATCPVDESSNFFSGGHEPQNIVEQEIALTQWTRMMSQQQNFPQGLPPSVMESSSDTQRSLLPDDESSMAPPKPFISEGSGPEVAVCEANLRGDCALKDTCGLNHFGLPYLWQILHVNEVGWQSLPMDITLALEKAFCDKSLAMTITQMPLIYENGEIHLTQLGIDLVHFVGEFNHPPHLNTSIPRMVQVRRLSTPSYGSRLTVKNPEEGACQEITDVDKNTFYTQWRWFYQDGTENAEWRVFEEDGLTPQQAVVEMKYLAGQEIFMFDVDAPSGTMAILLEYKSMAMKNLMTEQICAIRRRPIFIEPSDITTLSFTPWPQVDANPFAQYVPSNWYPLVVKTDFELVPINPEKVEFHLVASEFYRGCSNQKIHDIYRLQNPFLWHKYHCKRLQLERKSKVHEVQAFHGTDSEVAARSILHQNFDSRLAGKHATLYGQGCYFARNAAFSHKYTQPLPPRNQRTMFLARVLTGKYCQGHKHYRRPPPVDPQKPFGELYDSCVDRMEKPRIYVVFDSDQCYPEYVINYTSG